MSRLHGSRKATSFVTSSWVQSDFRRTRFHLQRREAALLCRETAPKGEICFGIVYCQSRPLN